jgi:hypothetical protein
LGSGATFGWNSLMTNSRPLGFIPNADRFESEIGKRYPAITSGGAILLQPATELRAGVDYRALKYWVWEDIALRHKIDSWIRTYA